MKCIKFYGRMDDLYIVLLFELGLGSLRNPGKNTLVS